VEALREIERRLGATGEADRLLSSRADDLSLALDAIDRLAVAERGQGLETLARRADWIFERDLRPLLLARSIEILSPALLGPAARKFVDEHVTHQVLPALTPLALGPGVQLARLSRVSGTLGVATVLQRRAHSIVRRAHEKRVAVIPIPTLLRRLIPVPTETGRTFVLLDEIVAAGSASLFHGYDVIEASSFRITRTPEGRPAWLELAGASAHVEELLRTALPEVPVCHRLAPLRLQDLCRLIEVERVPARRKAPRPLAEALQVVG
jgi:hypothetical protein